MSLTLERYGDVARLRMSSIGSRAVGLDVSAYVVRGVMIDSGFHRARRELVAAARSHQVRGVLLTHWHEDHAGNAPLLAELGFPVAMREDTEAILRQRPPIQLYRRVVWGFPPKLIVNPGTFAADEFECVHTPGHSPDHQVVWDAATGTLFSGDLWLGVRSRVLHSTEDPYQILESLARARALSPDRMFDAHRGLVEEPVKAITAKIEWLGETMQTIELRIAAGWSDRAIVRRVLGGEEPSALVSSGDYSRRNLVKAVRRAVCAVPPFTK